MKSGKKNSRRRETFGTLAAQIRETERQIMDRQHCVHVHTDTLVRDLQQEIRSPANLLLASGLGFIVGELTKPPPKKERQTSKRETDAKSDADITPLKKAVNFMTLAHTLYQALPLVWIMDTFYPEDASKTRSSTKVKKSQNQSF